MKPFTFLIFLILIGFATICFVEEGSGAKVFANPKGVTSKSSDGKAISAMPDTCESPPAPPAGPVPVPYPNTASSSDTTKGSKNVKTDAKEAMVKGAEYQQSQSDEPGTDESGTDSYYDYYKKDIPELQQEPVEIEGIDFTTGDWYKEY